MNKKNLILCFINNAFKLILILHKTFFYAYHIHKNIKTKKKNKVEVKIPLDFNGIVVQFFLKWLLCLFSAFFFVYIPLQFINRFIRLFSTYVI